MLTSTVCRCQGLLDWNATATISVITNQGLLGMNGAIARAERPPRLLDVAGRPLRLSIKSLQV
jgi:hypothetical protein